MSNLAWSSALFFSAMLSGGPSSAAATSTAPPELPFSVSDSDFQPLRDRFDPRMQRLLERALERDPKTRNLMRRKKLAVALVDLTEPATPGFARINGNTMMYAASLPKIAVLLAAYAAIDDGTLEDSPELQHDLTEMIRKSSNSAATATIDRLGFEKIAEVMTDPRFELYDRGHGGGLWVGKRFAKDGRRYPDPLKGLSHAATVTQVSRFYYQLATGRLISPDVSRQMLHHLSDPGLHHKFVGVLEKRAPLARLFRKSGTWKNWHSDSVLVWGPDWRRYILVAMVEDPAGETVIRNLVPLAENVLLEWQRTGPDARLADKAP